MKSHLIHNLARQDWWSRQKVISELVAKPEREYIGYLEEGIRNHENADIRNTAMEVYRALGIRAFPSLESLLRSEDPEIRLFAVNVLHQIGENGALPLLLSSIRDPDVNVRTASAEALGMAGNDKALEALKAVLEDDPWVGMAAVSAMGEIGGEHALNLLYGCLKREGYAEIAITAIKKAGNRESIKYLTGCFENEDLRETALEAIIKIAEKEQVRPRPEYFISLVPLLIKMFESQNSEASLYAFTALCWSEDIRGLPYLIKAVRDEELQEYAIEGLLRIGRKAVCSIVDELKRSAGCHRVILAKVLSMIGENRALLQFWEDEDPEVRVEVALGLCSLDLARAVRALTSMLSDPSEEVRLAAQKSLGVVDRTNG
jgi:HEAT repeat protein